MSRLWPAVLVGLLLSGVACALFTTKETRYLGSAQDRATQDEVRLRLGDPYRVFTEPTGETVWIYQVREEEPGSRWTSLGLWCDEYRLTFDRQAVLRQWSHRDYLHGGELLPTYCVPGGVNGE